jgi:hypothetical protein
MRVFLGAPNPARTGLPAAAGTPFSGRWYPALMGAKMTYLRKLPDAIASDVVVVHGYPRPTRRLGSRGFYFWLQPPDFTIEVCDCGWAPDFCPHFRVAKLAQ